MAPRLRFSEWTVANSYVKMQDNNAQSRITGATLAV
jgi:hypothetical protein